MRGFFRFLFGLIFVLSFVFLTTIFALKSTILSYNYIQEKLVKTNAYQSVFEAIPEMTSAAFSEAEKNDESALSGAQMGKILSDSLRPKVLAKKTESFLSGFYGWLNGEGPDIPEIDLSDVKPKIETYAAAEMGVTVSFIRSSDSGFSVPEKIFIKPVPALSLARNIFSHYDIMFYSSLTLAIVSVILVCVLCEDGLSDRFKKPATPILIAGIWILLMALFLWGAFGLGNLLYGVVSNLVGELPRATNIVNDLARGIITDMANILFIFSAFLIILGIALKIVGRIFKKKEIQKFQEEHPNSGAKKKEAAKTQAKGK